MKIAKFIHRVVRTEQGCLEFQGAKNQDGYGLVTYQGVRQGAHRAAWRLSRGDIPTGMHVLHRCDNPPCINIDHLFLGTQAQNNADRKAKRRNGDLRGSKHGRAVLTEEIVKEIRKDPKVSSILLAERFGISRVAIWKARTGRAWRHLNSGA